jgi:predicted nucleic acid-binding protein
VIVLDTSVVIDGLTGARRSAKALRQAVERGERLAIPSLVLYEWLRGPRRVEELTDHEALLPGEASLPFGPEEAAVAAELYKAVKRPRGREIDLAIAACAITRDAVFWTLNHVDFRDIPGLRVSAPG